MNENQDIAEVDGLFADHEQLTPEKNNPKVIEVPLDELHPFPGHPFRVMMDGDMDSLVTSIRQNGVLNPGIVRPRRQGGYEIIAGHRRKEASRLAGKSAMPVVVHDMDDNAATITMIETNLKQRSRLVPSERARAYRMMRDALVCQGVQLEQVKCESRKTKDRIAEHFGESASKVMRMIRLTYLNQDLLNLVDGGKLKLGLAVQISYMDTEVQCWIAEYHEANGVWPAMAQIKELRGLFDQGALTQDAFDMVMNREQPEKQSVQKDDFIASIRDEHFPDMTLDDVKDKVLELIEQYQHRKRLDM